MLDPDLIRARERLEASRERLLAHMRGEADPADAEARPAVATGERRAPAAPVDVAGQLSLLAALRQREHPQLLVAHRYITRPHNAGCENHIALSEHEFFTRAEQHLFALSWHANNNYYGIGIEIDLWLHAGFDVVANGSRAHLPQAQARYADALLPICLQVSPAVLRQRLEQRGRENETEIDQRLARAARYTPNECLMLNNDGRLSQSVDALVSLIRIHGNRREQQTA